MRAFILGLIIGSLLTFLAIALWAACRMTRIVDDITRR